MPDDAQPARPLPREHSKDAAPSRDCVTGDASPGRLPNWTCTVCHRWNVCESRTPEGDARPRQQRSFTCVCNTSAPAREGGRALQAGADPQRGQYLLPLGVRLGSGLGRGGLPVGAGLLGLFKQRLQLLRGAEQGVDHLLQVQPAPLLRHFQPADHRGGDGFGGGGGRRRQGRQGRQH